MDSREDMPARQAPPVWPTAPSSPAPTAQQAPPFVSQWGDLACNWRFLVAGGDPAAIHDWRADGYDSVGSYRRWSRNTCGLACLEEILLARDGKPPFPTKRALIDRAMERGVIRVVSGDPSGEDFDTTGIVYAPFVEWVAQDFGLHAVSRPDLPIEEAARLVAGGDWYAVLSVSYEIRRPLCTPTHTGGHLVLAFDAELPGKEGERGGARAASGLDGAGEEIVASGEVGAVVGISAGTAGGSLVFHNSSGLAPFPGHPEVENSAVAVRLPLSTFGKFYAGRGILVRRG